MFSDGFNLICYYFCNCYCFLMLLLLFSDVIVIFIAFRWFPEWVWCSSASCWARPWPGRTMPAIRSTAFRTSSTDTLCQIHKLVFLQVIFLEVVFLEVVFLEVVFLEVVFLEVVFLQARFYKLGFYELGYYKLHL